MRTLLFLLLLAASGHAAAQCTGKLIDYKGFYANGSKIGELQLYYDWSTGMNCAVTMHGGKTWGVPMYTQVFISRCETAECARPMSPIKYDESFYYKYRAGPVSIYGKGICVAAYGEIWYGGHEYIAATGLHC